MVIIILLKQPNLPQKCLLSGLVSSMKLKNNTFSIMKDVRVAMI